MTKLDDACILLDGARRKSFHDAWASVPGTSDGARTLFAFLADPLSPRTSIVVLPGGSSSASFAAIELGSQCETCMVFPPASTTDPFVPRP